jgi:hypothetical protein
VKGKLSSLVRRVTALEQRRGIRGRRVFRLVVETQEGAAALETLRAEHSLTVGDLVILRTLVP